MGSDRRETGRMLVSASGWLIITLVLSSALDVGVGGAAESFCFHPQPSSVQLLDAQTLQIARSAVPRAQCYSRCITQSGGQGAELKTVNFCFERQCRRSGDPEAAFNEGRTTASFGLAVSLCRNGTLQWSIPPSVSVAADLAIVLGLVAADGTSSVFKVVKSLQSHASLAAVFGDLTNTHNMPTNSCYRLYIRAVAGDYAFEPSILLDHFSLQFLTLSASNPGAASKCGGDLAHLGTLPDQSNIGDTSYRLFLSHFRINSVNVSHLTAVINVVADMLQHLNVTCQHTGILFPERSHNCHIPKVQYGTNVTIITIPKVRPSRLYFTAINLSSTLVNFTAHINFTSPNLKPKNVAVHKSTDEQMLVTWNLPLDPLIQLDEVQLETLKMKVFWRKVPSRMQSTQLQIVKRQTAGDGWSWPGRIRGYDFNSVPLKPEGNGEYSMVVRGLEPRLKYEVIVMGPTVASQAGLLTDTSIYDPASSKTMGEAEEVDSWYKKPLAVILFSVCGALLLVIVIICCFLALNRRRVERKREREARRRRFIMPLSCAGLGMRSEKDAWSPWGGAVRNGAVAATKQAQQTAGDGGGRLKNGTETAWVYVDKTPRDTPDLLSIADESECHVLQQRDRSAHNNSRSRTPTPSGGGRAVTRNLRTTGKATTIFRPRYKSTEQLDVPSFLPELVKQRKEARSDTPERPAPSSETHRSRVNTISNPLRQSMRKKKAKVMAELQQIGRGKPSSLRHRMGDEDLHETLNTERLTSLAKDELRHEGFRMPASPFSSGRSTPVRTPPEIAMTDEWEIPFEQLYLQDLLLDADASVIMKAELVGTELLDESGMPMGRNADVGGNVSPRESTSSASQSSPSSGLQRSGSLRKATLTKSKQPVVRSTSLHTSALTRKLVMVKMLKDIACDDEQRDFCREIGQMKRVGQHRHLVSMLGCCTVAKPLCMVMEYAAYGDLLSYLRARRPKKSSNMSLVSTSDSGISDARSSGKTRNSSLMYNSQTQVSANELMDFTQQIIQAMTYLASKGIVHRNLTSRTILLGEGHQVKLSDFSLNCQSARNDLAKGDHVKWMSIETLLDRTYTVQNDVWSFGVVLWEICTLGEVPYNTISNKQLLDTLQGGYRMRKPDSCSDKLYIVMLHCWSRRPASRPTFKDLSKTFESLTSKTNPEDHIDVDVLSRAMTLPYRHRPSSVSQVPPLSIESSRSSVRVTHSQPTTPRGDTVSFTWINPSDSDDDDSDDDESGTESSMASSTSVFTRSAASSSRHPNGTSSNRSSVHFAEDKLPRLIQGNSKEEVMRARSGSWNNTPPSATSSSTTADGKRAKSRPAEKVTIFDQNSSKSLTLQPSSYYLNEMRKYRESGRLPPDATRFSLSPDVTTVANAGILGLKSPSQSPPTVPPPPPVIAEPQPSPPLPVAAESPPPPPPPVAPRPPKRNPRENGAATVIAKSTPDGNQHRRHLSMHEKLV